MADEEVFPPDKAEALRVSMEDAVRQEQSRINIVFLYNLENKGKHTSTMRRRVHSEQNSAEHPIAATPHKRWDNARKKRTPCGARAQEAHPVRRP